MAASTSSVSSSGTAPEAWIRSVDGAPAADGMAPRPRVVVIGTGFGGMEAVRGLRREPVDVTLIDRNNYHKFQPLLYQVATAGLMTGHITQSVRHIFRKQANASVRMATVVGVDFGERVVRVAEGPDVPYDRLVLAAGASTAFFGVEGAREHGFPLKNVADAMELRAHLLRCFEAADENPARIDGGMLTMVVVGGGATGVETAGALTELFRMVLAKDFPALDVDRARVILVEMSDGLMQGYKPELQQYTKRALEERGVEVRLETAVERVAPDAVHLASGEVIPTHTTVWAAGVRANPLADALGVEQTQAGRVVVDEALRLPDHPEVFVIGDMAGARDAQGDLYPQVAQVAIQQGEHVAATLRREAAGLEPEPFEYSDLGQMATIGRNAAILQMPSGFSLTGFLAWMGWLLIHVVKLVGFRNQVGVLLSWVYNYFTYDRGPRLIVDVEPERDDVPLRTGRPRHADAASQSGIETGAA